MDFILVSIPLVLLTLTVIGVAINGFAKNVAQDIAVETARYAALADQDAASATGRGSAGLGLILGRIFDPGVVVTRGVSNSVCVYEVTVTLKPLALGFLSGISPISESARAFCELQ